MKHVVAIDQGTTGSTVLLLNEELQVVARKNLEFPQHYPNPGWVEHNPEEIWTSLCEALGETISTSKIDPKSISAIGITNQRETCLLWDRETLKPERNAIVWQDRRTADFCQALKAEGKETGIRDKTGLVLDPYFSASKLRWMFEEDKSRVARAQEGTLCAGTIDSYLVARLSQGAVHVTDPSNASRTMLYNINSGDWDVELLATFGIPRKCLPEVRSSSEVYALTRGVPGLPDGIPIAGMAGDQQAALFGQACFGTGSIKCTYGTGAFLLMNTGETRPHSPSGLLSTIAWQLGPEAKPVYALEGSAFIAGAAVQWLRDGLGIVDNAAEIEELATSVPDSGGVVFVPALAGLGAPHWRPEARGTIRGLTRGTTKAHLARAALEGIALQNVDIAKAMQADSGQALTAFRVDGGAAANNLLMQYQADVLNIDLVRPLMLETTALGAAFLAGLATSVWKNTDALARVWKEERRFSPSMPETTRQEHCELWNKAVASA